MTPEQVVDNFVICLWGFLFFWVFGVGGMLFRLEWGRIKMIGRKVKENAIDMAILGPFAIPLVVWLLVIALGGR